MYEVNRMRLLLNKPLKYLGLWKFSKIFVDGRCVSFLSKSVAIAVLIAHVDTSGQTSLGRLPFVLESSSISLLTNLLFAEFYTLNRTDRRPTRTNVCPTLIGSY